MKIKRFFTFILVVLALNLAAKVQAATYTVDDDGAADFSSIQDAIDAAGSGDTILVESGSYLETLELKSGVDVLGAGFGTTYIKGGHTGHVVYAYNVDGAVFDGFAVVDSRQDSQYAGVRIVGGSLVVSNNLITNNLRGISISGASSAIIRNNIITLNGINDGYLDYGIIVNQATPLITNNIVSRTTGAGIYVAWAGSLNTRIINNTIVDNDDDGIWCYRSSPIIKNNIITGNSYGIAASHHETGEPNPQISYNDVWNNADNYNSQSGGVAAPGIGDISVDPLLVPPASNFARGYYLGEASPCIDAGDPNPIYDDIDGTRNDMGAYGGLDGLPNPGFAGVQSGFVFTTVGKVPVSEITQVNTDSRGLANVPPDVASDLYIYPHADAPFGGRLWISGLFGPLDDAVRYYRIKVARYSPLLLLYQPLEDPLTKVLYTINTDGTVTASRETIGPLTNWKDIKGLYKRTDSGYWAHRDLKIVWNTSWFSDGLYSVTYEAYDSSLNLVPLDANSLSQFWIWIDNSPVEATIHSVKYDDGTVIPECGIISLASDVENLQFEVTAWHENGFLRNYYLSVLYGKNHNAGYVDKDQYVGSNDSTPPEWQGIQNVTLHSYPAMKAGNLDPWQDPGCAYQFHLRAWARTTDGFTHIRSATFNDHYYIQIGSASSCQADVNHDGSVDGEDLSIFADEYGSTGCR